MERDREHRPDPVGSDAEAQRLRAAIARRGPVETRLGSNAGQLAIVRERDLAIDSLIREGLPSGGSLLDIGCGEGATIGRLLVRGVIGSGVGVDLLPERIERARAAWPTVDFLVADASHLPFPDGTFDGVLAMTVFSSVPRAGRRAVAAEIARVIRPGGVFAWYDLRRPNPWNHDVDPFSRRDVAALFPGWRVHVRPLTVVPPLARRLGGATGMIYPVLGRLPVLLTHESGTARRPDAT